MRVLVLDNYDSFTYNLVQYLRELGAEVDIFRNDAISVPQVAAAGYHRIVISPGPGTPSRAGITVPLVREMAGKAPLLGVCLGHQAIGVAFGAAWSGPRPSATERHPTSTMTGGPFSWASPAPFPPHAIIPW